MAVGASLQRARGGPARADRARGVPDQPHAGSRRPGWRATAGRSASSSASRSGTWSGAGLFGFLINPPIALYYMQGLNTTPVHAHTALFGVYGLLSLGLVLLVARLLTRGRAWRERPLAVAFWAMNVGLGLMVAPEPAADRPRPGVGERRARALVRAQRRVPAAAVGPDAALAAHRRRHGLPGRRGLACVLHARAVDRLELRGP